MYGFAGELRLGESVDVEAVARTGALMDIPNTWRVLPIT